MNTSTKLSTRNPVVSIIMGSDSDLEIMKDAAKILEEFKVSYEITVVSAHRSPKRSYEYARSVEKRGVKVVIAGAGGAAHLPGVIAAQVAIPVIGVPVQTKSLNGIDSLLSIVQMPPGIPVATVGINAAKNAGILAISILGIKDKVIGEKLSVYKNSLEKGVEKKGLKLEKLGYKKYLDESIKNG